MTHRALADTSSANFMYAVQLAMVAAGYFLLGKWGLEYASLKPIVSLLWPPSGFALAMVLLLGVRVWPAIALGAYWVNWASGVGAVPALAIAAGNSSEAILAWYLLRRQHAFDVHLGRTNDVFALLLAAALAPCIAAVLGGVVYGINVAGVYDIHAALIWWMGDMTGILVVTPIILVWTKTPPRLSGWQWLELFALILCAAWVSQKIFFDPSRIGDAAYPAALALLPFVVWVALRFGRHGATAFSVVVASLGIAGTRLGSGAFIPGTPIHIMLRWWEYTTLIAVAALILAALRTERARAWLALAQSHKDLEKQIAERTSLLQKANQDLQAEMAARQQLERHLVEVGEQRRRRFGQDLHDGLGQYLTGITMMSHGLALALREGQPELAAQAERLCNVAGEAKTEGHRLASGLYPATLEKLGLVSAIQELASAIQDRDGVRCALRVTGEVLPALRTAPALHIFRIVQEAMHNAVRHGKASDIQIDLNSGHKTVQLTVRDNGCGFEPGAAHAKNSLGFHLMRQRAAVLGARLEVVSKMGEGSEIRLFISLPNSAFAVLE